MELDFLAGVVDKKMEFKMKRTIFRVSRGKAITTFWDIVNENNLNYKSEKKKMVLLFVIISKEYAKNNLYNNIS